MSNLSGHVVTRLTKEEDDKIKLKFKAYLNGAIKMSPVGWFYPAVFSDYAHNYSNFKLRSDDVFVLTYPKCGTTWTLETIWTMLNNPNLDNPKAEENYNFRTPFLEFDFILDTNHIPISEYQSEDFMNEVRRRCPGKAITKNNAFFNLADSLTSPRTIKTHLSFTQMPKNMLETCKVVYVFRHPKDVCISYYNHHKMYKVHDFVGTFDEFIDFFIKDETLYSPFWEHAKEAWNRRNNTNLFICFYEKMKQNPMKEYKRLNEFLRTNLSVDQLEKIIEYTSFSNMKTKFDNLEDPLENTGDYMNMEHAQSIGGFFRKGEAGDWKNKMTAEQNEKLDKWIDANIKKMDVDFREIFNNL